MPLIALTGGIASGKSTIAARLAEHGAVVIDADAIVHELQAPHAPLLKEIAAEFGDEMVVDGVLDRARLGAAVFGRPDRLAALNAIVHPAVKAESRRRFDAAFAADPNAVVVYDVPLLAEARGAGEWDLIIVADAPAELRVQRLIDLRGLAPEDAERRIASQASDAQRRALADVVIDTSSTVQATLAQTDALWERLAAASD
ncbi:dephospho-CoA kinase [Microbacterium gorillae]|uniref:dephospho-CoA kinase n=1 Tax=Microbacterium gorillae TaxID=1231063 RepID=UPI00058EA61F|nr:dephospho-CoA kinase [Microbacterium gorillae]